MNLKSFFFPALAAASLLIAILSYVDQRKEHREWMVYAEAQRQTLSYGEVVIGWTNVSMYGCLPVLNKEYTVVRVGRTDENGNMAYFQDDPEFKNRFVRVLSESSDGLNGASPYDFSIAEQIFNFDDMDGLLEIPFQKVVFIDQYEAKKGRWVIRCLDPAKK